RLAKSARLRAANSATWSPCGKHPCAIWNLRGVSPVGRTAQSGRENQSAAPTAETAGEIAERPGEVFTREELRRRGWPRRRKVLVILMRHSTFLSAKLRSALESLTEPLETRGNAHHDGRSKDDGAIGT